LGQALEPMVVKLWPWEHPDAIKKKQTFFGLGRIFLEKKRIEVPKKFRTGTGKKIQIIGANANNLKNVSISIPLGTFVSITGVSGSGKSSLIIDILSKSLSKQFLSRQRRNQEDHKEIKGIEHIDKVISIDQTPIGRTPLAVTQQPIPMYSLLFVICLQHNPKQKCVDSMLVCLVSMSKVEDDVEACSGEGYRRIPMQFLADVFVECNDLSWRTLQQRSP
jgi:excinuclease ABC subunit A